MVHSAVSQARRLLRAVSPSRFQLSSLRGEAGIVLALLGFAVVFNLYYLQPEIVIRVPKVNDGVMHVLALRQAVDALGSGWDPTDPWLSTISMGYPLFHYYQHLAYFPPAVFYKLFSALVSLPDVFNWTDYLLLSLFPLSIYWSMRRFGFSRLTSALAGVVSSLLATDGLYGFDYNSYVWRGYGLYTQLWGMVLLPPALAQGYTALKEGRGYFWAALLLAATALAHLVFGYIALISLVIFAVLSPSRREIFQRSRRFVLLLVSFALATAYFFIPLLRDSAYLNRSVWDAPEKYNSYGFAGVMGRLFNGELFDYGRFPSLTILAGLGLAVCLWRWREERFRVPAALSVLWLLLYTGRPVWGFLLDLQPLGRDLYLHRLIAGVHMGGIFLIGLGLALPWRWALSRGGALTRKGALYLLLPAVFTAAVLYPVFNERIGYFDGNDTLMQFSRNANAIEERDVSALISRLQVSPPGRVYAGLAGTWGRDYKVGYVPMYSILSAAGLDMLGYLYHPWSLNGDIQVLFDERRPEEYNLFNVRYVVAPKDRTFPDFVRPVQDFGRHRLYEVQTTGYFDLVDSPAAFTGSKRDFYPAASRWLSSDLPAQKQHPALFLAGGAPDVAPLYPLTAAEQVISGLHLTPGPSRGTIVSQTTGEDSYTAVVKVERESYLALKITYHPNWHAYVDGEEADTVMLMPSFEAVKLTPGAHLVRFEYRPPALRGYLLLLGLLSLTVVGIAEWQRGKLAQVTKRLKLDRFSYPSGLSALTAAFKRQAGRLVPFTIGRDIVKRKRDSLTSATVRLKQYVVQGLSAGLDWARGPSWHRRREQVGRLLSQLPPRWPFLRTAEGQIRQRLAPLTSTVTAWSPWRALVLLFLAAIIARVALSPLYAYLPENSLDEWAWKRWMQGIQEHGVLNVFRAVRTDYVGYQWVLWLLSTVYGWIGGSYTEFMSPPGLPVALHLLLKIPPIVFDIGLILAVCAATRALAANQMSTSMEEGPETTARGARPIPEQQLGNSGVPPAVLRHRLALAAAAVIAFHPAILYDSAVWAQIDAAITAAMLASVVLVARGIY